ncbi:hypothetical protein EU527_02720 [Candidatus Thorarchaeota archaeon]|nr:MAG: hypothetical protein EU527_02720 [Candidatus Thorarchaeota archaeon]
MRCIRIFIIIFFILASTISNSNSVISVEENLHSYRIHSPSSLTIERDWTVNIILVNYDESIIDEIILLDRMPAQRVYSSGSVVMTYNIQYDVYYASSAFSNDLMQIVIDNSVNGTDTGTYLDEVALLYQKNHLDEPQRIFYPRDGRTIDAYAIEDWLVNHPYVAPPDLGYTLYLVNFSALDSSDHSLEHWYDYHPIDPDTGEEQDWFRLEWDNALNPNVTMDYSNFGGKYNSFFVDPSAHQWYLKWCRIWWSEYIGTEYDFWAQDLEDKVSSLDLETPSGINDLNIYLQECIWDPINLLFFPYQHQPAKYCESGLLRALVICMDVEEGISVDSLRWVTNSEVQKAHLEELYPFISWNVDVQFLDIDEYPLWNTTFWSYATLQPDGMTIVDGGGMFDAIYSTMRPNYINVDSTDINVFGAVFIKQQMEMHVYGRTYTGLGGGGQTVIWKSWERYYRPDGITPKDGISAIQLHETMHAIGFHHTWQHEQYSSDFSYGPMGYFAYHNGTASFDKNWVQGTYLDQMEALLYEDFTEKQANLGVDERSETYMAEQKILDLFDDARSSYNEMDWHAAFNALKDAEKWIKRMMWSTHDDTAPVISTWEVLPRIITDGFEVRAQVTDDLSGLENVSVYLWIDQNIINVYPCAYSSGTWNAVVPEFMAANTVEVWIVAWDWAMNIAESTHEVASIATGHTVTTNTTTATVSDLTLLLYASILVASVSVIVVVVVRVLRRQ